MQVIGKLRPVSQGALLRWAWHEPAIRARLLLVALLSAVLVEAVGWAMDVTQANAKRISTNIVRLQESPEASPLAPEKRVLPLRAGPIVEALRSHKKGHGR